MKDVSKVPMDLLASLRRQAKEPGRPLDRDRRKELEAVFGQDLGSVVLHFGNQHLLDALRARGVCWQHHIFLPSEDCDAATVAHEIAHAAQWLRCGGDGRARPGSISRPDDACEREADRFAHGILMHRQATTAGVVEPRSAEFLLDSVSARLLVECEIVGHASPRWRAARSEQDRVRNNDRLSQQRADALAGVFAKQLREHLKGYSLEFRYNQTVADANSLPQQTVLVGAAGRGQRESIVLAGGNKSADDQIYRRADLNVKVARMTQEEVPTVVTSKTSSKHKWWYVGVGLTFSVGYGAPTASFLRLKLTNFFGQTAEGSIVTGGGGWSYLPFAAAKSWSDDSSFITNRPVEFNDFHGCHVQYNSASVPVGVFYAYNWSYLTFRGMGAGADSIPVGGWESGIDFGGTLNEGILILDHVPPGYIITDQAGTVTNKSEWITTHNLQVFFEDGKADLSKSTTDLRSGLPAVAGIMRFAAKVAADVRSQ